MNELALFAGAGGGILGGKLLGWRTICAVEWDAYAASVLVARQNDGCLEPFPIWDDVQSFDGKPWRGRVDVVSGGFPCTDISCAGKGAGIDGEASGMWRHMARIIGEVRPRFVFVENSPMLTLRGLDRVLGDLSTLGFDARWGVVGAHHAGAPHKRERIWIVADSHGWGQQERRQQNGDTTQPKFKTSQRNDACRCSENVADADGSRFQEHKRDRIWIVANSNSQRGCRWNAGRQDAVDADAGGKERLQNTTAIRTEEGWECTSCGLEIFNGCRHDHGEWECIDCGEWTYPFYYEPEDGCQHCGSSNIRHAASAGLPHGTTEQMGEPGADAQSERSDWWATEPDVGRVAHGVAARVDRLRCIGNGQVPAVAALAWQLLTSPPKQT